MKQKTWIYILIAVLIVVGLIGMKERFDNPPTSTTEQTSPNDSKTPPVSAIASQANVTGTTTGGTTASSLGPTSNPNTSRGTNVWGPQGNGTGEAPNNNTSVNPNQMKYPQLLGGMGGKSGTMIPGVGVVPPSKNVELVKSGQLPTSAGLGSNENSQYLPYSRTPGDQDLVPNPYKGEFSSSNYSVKNEPVPFLTDFSAFMK